MSAFERTQILLVGIALGLFACGEMDDPLSQRTVRDDGSETNDDEEGEGAAPFASDEVATVRDAGISRADGGGMRAPGSAGDAGDAGDLRADAGASADAGRSDAGSVQGDAASASDLPSLALCAPARAWSDTAAQFEAEVLRLTNEARARGHDCGSQGRFGPTGALKAHPALRCAARLHSKYMAETGDFSHVESATQRDLAKRLSDVGYRASTWGENIAFGQRTPAEVVTGWLESDGHCRNIMSPSFTELGVGYVAASRGTRATPYWTQNFGAPRR